MHIIAVLVILSWLTSTAYGQALTPPFGHPSPVQRGEGPGRSVLMPPLAEEDAASKRFGVRALGEPGLRWYTLQTEHFRITFPLGLEGLAQEAAVAAEEAHGWLSHELGYAPHNKVDIVLCDATDVAHRGLEIFENKITICVAQGKLAENFNPRLSSWVRQSVFVQYAQLVSADFVFGLSEALRPLMGKTILPNRKPLTLLEGLATYLTEKTLRVPQDTRTAMELRALLLAEKTVSPEHAESWFFRYLTEQFGPEIIREWHRLQANDLQATLTLGFLSGRDQFFRRLTGRSFEQIALDFQGWLRRQFSEQIEKINAEGVTASTPFHSHRQPPSPPRERQLASPDGRKILYVKRDVQKHSYLYGDLYLYDLTTKRETRLTENARVYRAAFFPDGQKILIAHYRWGDQGPVLAVFDAQTRQITPLKEFPLHDYFIDSFEVSPDGETVALSIWRRGGYQDIYLLNLSPGPSPKEGGGFPLPFREGGKGVRSGKRLGERSAGVRALTRDRAVDLSPAFSPDGHFVLFASDRDGVYNLYAYRMADGSFFRVTNVLTGAFDPDISPDGTEIAFVTYALQGYEMHTVSFDSPSWRPVQIEPEPFPPWDGFPDTEYPIIPYDPRPSLEPTLWVPLPGWNSLSLLTFGSDALKQHLYSILLGFNWQTLQPSYRVSYHNRVLLSSLETLLERAGKRAHQSVTATLPLATSVRAQQSLSLFYRRDEEDFILHRIGLEWRGAWKIFQNWLEFSLWAVTQTRTGQRRWENHLGFRVAGTTPLPLGLRGSIFAEWGEGFTRSPLVGAELQFSPDVALRLGLLWDAERHSVKFYLR